MTVWEKKIINALIDNFFASKEERKTLRLRSSHFFPDFDNANPDEKESYLEAAEHLQQKEIIILRWEKRGKGERLKTLSCENFKKLFAFAGKQYPKDEVEEIKNIINEKIKYLKITYKTEDTVKILPFLEYLSNNFGKKEIAQGIDKGVIVKLVQLLEFVCVESKVENITTRALSILLYNDSKYLETLMELCSPLFLRVKKKVNVPDLSFLKRKYPQTMISGKIIIEFKNQKEPIVNANGHILALPLETAEAIASIKLISDNEKKTVLVIENKETFYALGSLYKNSEYKNHLEYDCFLYAGGYSNRAAAAIIKILSNSGFEFYHAGDLDPDGILIMQHVQDIAGKQVTPVKMNVETFEQYRPWGRTLNCAILRQTAKIREDTRKIPGIAELLHRIEETGIGIEQEIIDYRNLNK